MVEQSINIISRNDNIYAWGGLHLYSRAETWSAIWENKVKNKTREATAEFYLFIWNSSGEMSTSFQNFVSSHSP